MATDINVNNNSMAGDLSTEETFKSLEKVPTNVLREVLKAKGII